MKTFLFLMMSFLYVKAWAFPDMVRHGYTTCVTCHFSPSGGGLLTSYGKFIAGELFGAWNSSDDALPWLVTPVDEPKFSAGILARGTQIAVDTPQFKKGYFRRMQLDLEVGALNGPWLAFITSGLRGSSALSTQKDTDLKVRSFYAGHVTLNHAYRVGRFYPEYGLRFANHNIPTRKYLYWNQGDEPYVAQASIYTSSWEYNFAALSGAKETQLAEKNGGSGSLVYKTANTRTGFSMLNMKGSSSSTNSESLFSQIGYMDYGYTLGEIAFKHEQTSGSPDSHKTLVFIESGYEVVKGFIPYIGYQRNEVQGGGSVTSSTPIGIRIYPMTHAEVILEYQPVTTKTTTAESKSTYAFAMFNTYF